MQEVRIPDRRLDPYLALIRAHSEEWTGEITPDGTPWVWPSEGTADQFAYVETLTWVPRRYTHESLEFFMLAYLLATK